MSKPKLTPIDATIARKIAQRAYYATIETIARHQQLILNMHGLIDIFGDRALPPDKMLRGYPSQMKRGAKNLRAMEEQLSKSLADDYKLAELLEERFEAEEASSMEAFARDMAARMHADMKADKRKDRSDPEGGIPGRG